MPALVEPASNLVDALAQSDRDLIDASLISVPGYFDSAQGIKAGQQYGQEGSGVRPSTLDEFAIPGAFILSDGAGRNRFPIKAAADGGGSEMPLTRMRSGSFSKPPIRPCQQHADKFDDRSTSRHAYRWLLWIQPAKYWG